MVWRGQRANRHCPASSWHLRQPFSQITRARFSCAGNASMLVVISGMPRGHGYNGCVTPMVARLPSGHAETPVTFADTDGTPKVCHPRRERDRTASSSSTPSRIGTTTRRGCPVLRQRRWGLFATDTALPPTHFRRAPPLPLERNAAAYHRTRTDRCGGCHDATSGGQGEAERQQCRHNQNLVSGSSGTAPFSSG